MSSEIALAIFLTRSCLRLSFQPIHNPRTGAQPALTRLIIAIARANKLLHFSSNPCLGRQAGKGVVSLTRIWPCHRSNKCENANLTLFIIHSLPLGRVSPSALVVVVL